MNKIKVLELGWEFPPLINGGLGIACYGLSKALAKLVDLKIIVPMSDAGTNYQQEGFSLTGLNNISNASLQNIDTQYSYESFARVETVPVYLDPYVEYVGNGHEHFRITKQGIDLFSQNTEEALNLFRQGGDLYSGDLAAKVIEFSKLAAKLALKEDFDIIHAHDWMTYLAGVEVKKSTGKPLVVHLHASQFDRAGPEARGWIYDIEKYGMEQADAVIPVSHYTGTIVTGHYGIDPHKVCPIYNGADPVVKSEGKKKFPEKLVLFLGRLTAQKGPEFFLKIAAKVLEKNQNVRFVMAGTGEKLKQLIESGAFHGLGGKFHFTGFLNKQKVNELLAITDIYCMPSVSEPFGLSALEAAQYGIPAVISKQSGAAEVLKAALQADFWDINLMAQHIVDLIEDPELYAKVVADSHADIEAATWDAAAIKVEEIYRRLLKS